MAFKRSYPRKASCFYIKDIEAALSKLRAEFGDVEFSKGGDEGKLVVSLSGSKIHDTLVEKRVLELGGFPV